MDQGGTTQTCVPTWGGCGMHVDSVAEMYGKGYGMPSSHAQFVAYFSVSLALFLLLRHVPHPSATRTPSSFSERFLLSATAVLCAGAVAGSRIYLSYHTPKQVFVGCAAGAASAVAWFCITACMRRFGLVEWLLDSRIACMLRMRDLVVDEDLVDAGWERWEARRKYRQIMANGIGKKIQ